MVAWTSSTFKGLGQKLGDQANSIMQDAIYVNIHDVKTQGSLFGNAMFLTSMIHPSAFSQ